ncbi:hypothetical protein U5801_27400, partial [Lamprobacter modestohalophilus]|uniref:hypothetical protein n=1 Tax=Lamprobacter modestohalophilus TaxID=1064514 RepID=UPI002ADEE1FB
MLGSLRLGHLTLMPEGLDATGLCYRTHNGGVALETFALAGAEVHHGRALSFLVSANQAVGLTQGLVELGDAERWVRLRCGKTQAALVGLVTHQPVQGSHFTRLALSARELDDTSRPTPVGPLAV